MKLSIPVIREVDVLLLGGTISGCCYALKFAEKGYRVFAATPYAYFGDDLCAVLDMQSEKSAGYRAIFPEELYANPTPLQVKAHLDRAFTDAGIDFLFHSYPVAVAEDADGNAAGVVIANRTGFQVIRAKCILDASRYGSVVSRKPFVPGEYNVSLIQYGACTECDGITVETLPLQSECEKEMFSVYKATKRVYVNELTPAELNRITGEMRRACFHSKIAATAPECYFDFGDLLAEPDPADGILTPSQFGQTESVLRQRNIGKAVRIRYNSPAADGLEVCRLDPPVRYADAGDFLEFDLNRFPVLERCDVLVTGAGTGGGPAAIAAADQGAATIVTDMQSHPGGLCTSGMICAYWFGNRCGFSSELDRGCRVLAGLSLDDMPPIWETGNYLVKQHWLLLRGQDAGTSFRFQTLTAAAVLKNGAVCGALCVTPLGCGMILADACVDSTGNADLAAAAGARTEPMIAEEPTAVQGAGHSPFQLHPRCENSDYTFVCDSDVADATRILITSREKFTGWFDTVSMLDTRERRRLAGVIQLQPHDFYANRTYEDTINIARSNFDTHGVIIHPMFMLKATEEEPYYANVPYRALLPETLDGVLVTGLGVSAHRDCMPLIRMQADVQNQGYAAGVAAAMTAKNKASFRDIDIKALQKVLIGKEILPERVLTETDCIGEIREDSSHYELASIFQDPEKALPVLKEKLAADPEDVHTAHILAFLGDDSGKQLLEQTLHASPWDEGWKYRGMGQFGPCVSYLDSIIFALDRVNGDAGVILEKLSTLTPDSEYSHYRAVCMFLIHHPVNTAAADLKRLLALPGMTGYAIRNHADALASNRPERNDTTFRNSQLKELYLAKALQACAPGDETAEKILHDYGTGLQAYYAAFAKM